MINVRAILLSLLLLPTVVGTPALATKGVRLKQTSDFLGQQVTSISPKSIRIESEKYGLKLQVSKPDFELKGINVNNHLYTKLGYAEARRQFLGHKGQNLHGGQYMVKRGRTKIAGFDADEWWVFHPTMSKSPDFNFEGRNYNVKYWVTRQIKAPPQMFALLVDSLKMPTDLGFPLKMIQFSQGRSYVTFNTSSVEICDVPDDLIVPPEYKKAREFMALLVSGLDSDLGLGGDDSIDASSKDKIAGPGWVPGMKHAGAAYAAQAGGTTPKPVSSGWFPGR